MTARLAVAALLLCASLAAAEDDVSKEECFLLGGALSAQPFPSLSQCYKHNGPEGACCVSAHDSAIAGSYGGLFSDSCAREYPLLAQFYCLGCDPLNDKYIVWYSDNRTEAGARETYKGDSVADAGLATGATGRSSPNSKSKDKYGRIRLCTSFANKLMYASGEQGSLIDKYDKCGLAVEYETQRGEGDMYLSSEFFVGDLDDDGNLISECSDDPEDCASPPCGPSDVGDTCVVRDKEWHFFDTLRPTFYESDNFDIIWKDGDTPLTTDCFGAAPATQLATVAIALVAFVAQQLA